MALSQEAVQSMLDAMKIISSAEMNNISYDTTIICSIVDNSHAAKESYYTVTDGSIKFKAFVLSAEDATKYKIDDQVYVKVPGGDFTRQKVIEGYYVADSAEVPATYVSPLTGFLGMKSLTDDAHGNYTLVQKALVANKSPRIALWNWSINALDDSVDDLQLSGLYDTLILQAQFKSLLDTRKMNSGSYGLALDLYVRLHPTSDLHIIKTLVLDSSEMFGNPYAFAIYSTQAKSFNISQLGIVDGMTLYFYQNNDFTYVDSKGNIVELPSENVNPNLFVDNIYIAMGSDIVNIADNSLKIYNLEDQSFKFSEPNDTTNKKNIGFVWYNKDDSHNYLGFSDGRIYTDDNDQIINYDELAYLEESAQNNRLLEQQGKDIPTDKNGLLISANVTEGETLLKNIGSLLQINFVNTLSDLHQRTQTLSNIKGASSNDYFQEEKTRAKNYAQTFIDDAKALMEWYKGALSAAAAIQVHQTNGTKPESVKIINLPEKIYHTLKRSYITFKETYFDKNFILNDLKESIESLYNGYQSVYDTYSIKLNKIFTDIDAAFEKLDVLLENKEQLITSSTDPNVKDGYQYHIDTKILPFESADLSDYDNRYCVYWYRKDDTVTDDPIMEAGWQRLTPGMVIETNSAKATMAMPHNLGLPTEFTNKGTTESPEYYLTAQTKSEEGFLTVYLNPNKKEEKFKVVLFYNHEKFVSDELVFTNADEVVDTTTLDVNGSIKIAHGTNSKDTYQTLYNSNNTLINQADDVVNRQLTVHYDGALGSDDSLAEAQIFWYIPRYSTMLDVHKDHLVSQGFTTDYYRTVKVIKDCEVFTGPGSEYKQVPDVSYKVGDIITEVYDKQANFYSLTKACTKGIGGKWISEDCVEPVDNAEIYMDGFACFYKTIGFTEETVEEEKIKKVKEADLNFEYRIKNYYVPTALNNTIFCIVKKADYTFETSISMTFGTQGTCGTDYTLLVQPATNQRGVKIKSGEENSPLPLSLQLFNYNNEEIPIHIKTTSEQGSAGNLNVKWYGPSVYDDILQDEEGVVNSVQITLTEDSYASNDIRCGIAQIGVTVVDEKYGRGNSELSVKYPVPYSAGNYYIEGPTTVIYDSNGGNPIYYKEKYRLFDGDTNTVVDDITWKLKYFMFNEPALSADSIPKKPTYWFENGCIYNIEGQQINPDSQSLSTQDQKIVDEVAFYWKCMPKLDSNHKLIPSVMYVGEVYDEAKVRKMINAYPVVCAYDVGGTLLWAQPIVIDQNRYPNAVANAWDGEFVIDEKNGTIMSTMVGAGYKNTDNTFSGVMMGNLAGGESVTQAGNKTDVGLYGFDHGAQSFGLNIDGTAFFGKAGRGRILIDGNDSTIQSQSYASGDTGMKIDLDDGYIDMKGTTYNDGMAESDGTTSKIRIDVKSPYFTIHSSGDEDIIHIANDEYYLKSDNYEAGAYPLVEGITLCPYGYLSIKSKHQVDGVDIIDIETDEQVYKYSYVDIGGNQLIDDDGNEVYLIPKHVYDIGEGAVAVPEDVFNGDITLRKLGKGQGTRLDLKNGAFDAYYLKLTSKNVYLDSSEDANPYFVVRDDHGHNLIYTGRDEYYLKSCGFSEDDTIGMKLNLVDGKLEGYNFSLRATSNFNEFAGSYILLDSGTNPESGPQLIVHYQENQLTDSGAIALDDNQHPIKLFKNNLLTINKSDFIMRSKDWYSVDDDLLEPLTRTVSYYEGQLDDTIADQLNIRRGPSTDYKSIRKLQSGMLVKIYNYNLESLSNGWYSLQPPTGVNDDGTLIFAQGNNSEGEWVSSKLSGVYCWNFGDNPEEKFEEIIIPRKSCGQKIDIGQGNIILHKNELLTLEINSKADKFPFQLGAFNTNEAARDFRIGWDGALYGGSQFPWSIDANGRAAFQYIQCSGGTLENMQVTGEIYSGVKATIEGEEGTEPTVVRHWVINPQGATFNNLKITGDLTFDGWYTRLYFGYRYGPSLSFSDSMVLLSGGVGNKISLNVPQLNATNAIISTITGYGTYQPGSGDDPEGEGTVVYAKPSFPSGLQADESILINDGILGIYNTGKSTLTMFYVGNGGVSQMTGPIQVGSMTTASNTISNSTTFKGNITYDSISQYGTVTLGKLGNEFKISSINGSSTYTGDVPAGSTLKFNNGICVGYS